MHFMASDRGLHCLVTECNYKIWIELNITTKQQLHSKWIRPIGKGNPLSINWLYTCKLLNPSITIILSTHDYLSST